MLIDKVYNGTLNGLVPFVFGEGDDGQYTEYMAYQWQHECSAQTGVPCVEAREPCSVLMYVDVRSKSQKDARPSPIEWHWSRINTAPPTSLTWSPDAVLVTCKVWIVSSPEPAERLEEDGNLIFCALEKILLSGLTIL